MREDDTRVALIDNYADGHHPGYLIDLALGLRSLGAEVLVIAPESINAIARRHALTTSVPSYEMPPCTGLHRQWVGFNLFRKIINEAVKWEATHIHFLYGDWHIAAIAAAWYVTRPTAKLVLTIHWSAGAGVTGNGFRYRVLRHPHRAALQRLINRNHARVLVHHEAVAAALSPLVAPERIGIVAYPTNPLPTADTQTLTTFRRGLGLKPQDKLILCYGGTRYDKGADLAIRALAFLPHNYHLLIAGEPRHFQPNELRRQAAVAGVEVRTHIIPRYLTNEESSTLFYACDAVLLPYRHIFSGLSGPLVQGAAIGKPVVVADLPVLAQTVHKFRLGVVFPAGDIGAMARAVESAMRWHPVPQDTEAFIQYHSPITFSRDVYRHYASTTHKAASWSPTQ